jgi:L,D-transpeptidase catalytic domain
VSRETPSTPECEALMVARPTPNVSLLPADLGILSDVTFIRFNKNDVNIYDSPGGSVKESMTTGYMYVAPVAFQDGWAQLGTNRWVSLEDARYGSPSEFSGVTINGALDMPFAWVLWGHDARTSPNGVSDRETGHLNRFQLVNIYATVNVSGWNWYLIGPGHWTNQQNLSIVYPHAPAEFGGNWVGINLYEQNLVAYSGGSPVMATLVSSGVKNGEWDTRLGTFDVDTKVEAGTMNGAEGSPDFYSLDLVPYAQYFDGLISLHGTYWHDSFGFPHSHGCVNLTVTDAHWLFGFLGEGSTVHVYE